MHSNSDPEVFRRRRWVEVTTESLPLEPPTLPCMRLRFPKFPQRRMDVVIERRARTHHTRTTISIDTRPLYLLLFMMLVSTAAGLTLPVTLPFTLPMTLPLTTSLGQVQTR